MRKILFAMLLLATLCLPAACKSSTDELSLGEFYKKLNDNIYETDLRSEKVLAIDFGLGLYTDSLCFIPRAEVINDADASASGTFACINISDNHFVSAGNIYERVYPASITKLMTTLLALKYSDLTDTVVVSDTGTDTMPYGAQLCGFEVGDTMTMETLLTSMVVWSGNDASYIIATHISGSEDDFVRLMNEEAAGLLAIDTNYVNSHGLHNVNHYTTLYDVYLIFNECLKYEKFREMISLRHYTAEYYDADGEVHHKTFEQTNLYFTGHVTAPAGITINGGKTGSTLMAGNCLILSFTGRDEKEYICAAMNLETREELYRKLNQLMESAY